MNIIKNDIELSDFEFNNFYEKSRKLIFNNYKSHLKFPIAILTGGQPGAGKGGLVIKAKNDFAKFDIIPIILDSDMYRILYPNAKEISVNNPEKYAKITDVATGKVMENLIKECILKGYSFIREGTLNSAEIVDQLIESNKSYKIIIRLLATCREESILSCFERYIFAKKNKLIARFITIESHDKRYVQFPKTARIQEKKGLEIEVYERGKCISLPKLLYNNKIYTNGFNDFEEAIEFGRAHSLKLCKNNLINRIFKIEKELKNMNTNEEEILKQLEKFKKQLKL